MSKEEERRSSQGNSLRMEIISLCYMGSPCIVTIKLFVFLFILFCFFFTLFCYTCSCVPVHLPSSNVPFDILFHSNRLDDIHCMVWVCFLMDRVVGSRMHIQRVLEWTRVLFFLRVCQGVGDIWWHSHLLAQLISSTTHVLFQWIAQHRDRLHRDKPDCTAH